MVLGAQRLLKGFKPNWARTRNVALLASVIGEWRGGREGGREGLKMWV